MAHILLGILWVLATCVNGKETKGSETVIVDQNTKKERNFVNMGELGAFDTGYPFDYPPLERMLSEEPDSRETIGTVFRFFRSTKKNIPLYLSNMNFSSVDISESDFCRKCKTYFLIHDYDGKNAEWQCRLENALLNRTECNIFIVNWNTDVRQPYEKAIANIRVVGAEVGFFMQRITMFSVKPRLIHIIGHGLGAHASGYAGKWFHDREELLVGRITGLDPAGPFFNGVENIVRLDKGDASFVDIIHTNMDGQSLKGYGLKEPIGHLDFYPNGGEIQPGCSTELSINAQNATDVLSYMNSVAIIKKYSHTSDTRSTVVENISDLSCSHARAYEYFIASLDETNCKFVSLTCYSWNGYYNGGCASCDTSSCIRMGFYSDVDGRAIKSETSLKLYVTTKSSPNFCYVNLLKELSDKSVLNKYRIEHLNKRFEDPARQAQSLEVAQRQSQGQAMSRQVYMKIKLSRWKTEVVCTLHDMKDESVVDMEELGIFDTGCPFDYPRMERAISLKPHSRENINTEFSLFSSTNKDISEKINNTHFFCWSEQHKGFPRAIETYFILRDYLGRNSEWQLRLKDAILKTRACNVFVVDWSDDKEQHYEQAVANIRVVGAEVGLLIERLVYVLKFDPGQVHIIGHGLGAHAAGYAGKWFQNRQNKLIGRITGLDPAGPYFNGVHKVVRLDKGDAKFVDVIHTNLIVYLGYGLKTPIGHADYYPNGGEFQPGCESSLDVGSGNRNEFASYTSGFNVIDKLYFKSTMKATKEEHRNLVCSHNRAYEYFIESLEDVDCKFDSMSCYNWHAFNFSGCGPCNLTTCMSMGFYSDIDTYSFKFEGPLKLYLKTNDFPPYCIPNPQRQISKLYSDTKRFLKQIYQRCNLLKIGIKDLLCL
ncbi:uncharacterized protein LOC118181539 [Stegodyphus dumicola]|uniref:uncharacterized protein LOC118181539 n=1 Tax=Stegodyphus dumicola TaxID=202533 RepID=UPI0015AB567F|nr:uncharacterized protein LOC118181539 [Stegodyphus dumicola]